MMMRQSDYENAAKRYRRTVVNVSTCTFALFVVMLWVSVLMLEPHVATIRQWAVAVGPIAQVLFPLAVFAASSPVPLIFLFAVVRRARLNSRLHCPECRKFIGDIDSEKHITMYGTCPRCDWELLSNSKLDSDVTKLSQDSCRGMP